MATPAGKPTKHRHGHCNRSGRDPRVLSAPIPIRVRPRRKPDRGPFIENLSPFVADHKKKERKKVNLRNITRLANGRFRISMKGLSPRWKQGRQGDYVGTYADLDEAIEVRNILLKHQRINQQRPRTTRRQGGLSLAQARAMDTDDESSTERQATPYPVTPIRLIRRSKSQIVRTKSPIIMSGGKSTKIQIPAGTPAIVLPEAADNDLGNPFTIPVLERQNTLGFEEVVDFDPLFKMSPIRGKDLNSTFDFNN